ncbi:type ISP restriction/modification enzyme [Crateriforma conspicua]|uniref:site-specific DNA-methyltransferase (adenine-specific) n=1 Tax=Crateriforma conspicua TaxID=2527996 RepID=A0A5C5Y109_9PLAN|nr:type ISP restriction/modification enzyme [Crateriforma conspicua]TWT69446.1 N-6 DNA Methylase [Crateriforma conspicua]
MKFLIDDAISKFGESVTAKSTAMVTGEPEDQLRGPLETLIADLAEFIGFKRGDVTPIGESSVQSLHVRPDFAVTVKDLLTGFVEVKAPGKGADPNRYRDKHDKEQWEKLQSLPNLLYTDGNEFALLRDGELVREVVKMDGEVDQDGAKLKAPPTLVSLFEDFFGWQPVPPRSAGELATVSARLCRLLRDEVTEQLRLGTRSLTDLANDWRDLLFPEADDETFADGYAQTVTFGLLAARAQGISLEDGMHTVGKKLAESTTLIGTALRVVTEDVESNAALKTSFETLRRVLAVVEWERIVEASSRRGKSEQAKEPWLYFYEEFLAVYDNDLRKKTGSYYTPPEVVSTMVRLTDEALCSRDRFGLRLGLADDSVHVADPAVGTGTFLLGVLRQIANTAAENEGPGSVGPQIAKAVDRLIGFEIQLGPFAVAQLRVMAELTELIGKASAAQPRLFVTNTLADPYIEEETFRGIYRKIAESRRQASTIKREQPITVVIGNPPYKEKARGKGAWIENGSEGKKALLKDWSPPSAWGVGAHGKHMKNLYAYFWRWAVWKALEHPIDSDEGVVCYITPAGFLAGPGFDKMRADLREKCSEIFVIECSPEGHRPEVPTRIFEGVQHPVCITLAIRCKENAEGIATVWHRRLEEGPRTQKFDELQKISLSDGGWTKCSPELRAPFLPAAAGEWGSCLPLLDLFIDDFSGTMAGRVWPIAPDAETLHRRWRALLEAKGDRQEELFKPHLRRGKPGDRHAHKELRDGLHGYDARPSIANEPAAAEIEEPVRYAYRTLDRQWIIPDKRLINQPNPTMWEGWSDRQIYVTFLTRISPQSAPAATFCGYVPDLDHYKGHAGGRIVPLWRDAEATLPNFKPALLNFLNDAYGSEVDPADLMAYIAGIVTAPAYFERFEDDLDRPGLRLPLTADPERFASVAAIGREVIWLHTFGERFVDADGGRPEGPPRLVSDRPIVPADAPIPVDAAGMPDDIDYDAESNRLLFRDSMSKPAGAIANVTPAMWNYRVSSDTPLVRQWFSYRKKDRSRPLIGDRRPPSDLNKIQPDHWLPEYTTELLNVLNIIGRLIALEPKQAEALSSVLDGPLLTFEAASEAGILAEYDEPIMRSDGSKASPLFDE